ncbi:MAG: hypothetical protein D6683_09860 [Actinomyces sp.]|nr:MAG: hypothetical protein D6683_09860 [Actinomyces sp.]
MLLVAVLAAACRIDTSVDIAVDADGSGRVTVTVVADADAVAAIPDAPDQLRLDDLEAAGWTLDGPTVDDAGALTVTASKPFGSPEELPVVLTEIAGPGSLFEGVELRLDRGFARTTYELTGTIDPSPDLESFGDEELARLLAGEPLGRPVDELLAGVDPAEALGLTVVLHLPDDVVADNASVEGATATWTLRYGDPPLALDARGTVENLRPRLWAAGAILALGLFLLLLLVRIVRRVVRIWRTPKGRRPRDRRRREQRAAVRQKEAERPRRRLLRLLVLDAHGVVVRPTDPLEGLLLPVVRGERPDADPDLVRDRYRKLVLGRLSPDEFWSEVGLGPVAEEVETRYLSSFRLVPGLHAFLDRMGQRGLPVAVVGNDPRRWGDRLRRMASLDGAVAAWVVSGDVGATLPERPLFEATRRLLAVDLEDCLYLSAVPAHLDAAAALGLATVHFAASPADGEAPDHAVIHGFDEMLRGRGS